MKECIEVAAVTSLVGYRRVDYVSKKTSRHVMGYTFYFNRSGERDDVQGSEAFEGFISDANIDFLKNLNFDDLLGVSVELNYNQYGNLRSFRVI